MSPSAINSMEILWKSGKMEDYFPILAEVNQKSDWMWTVYAKCMIVATINVAMMFALSVAACFVINGRFDTKYLFHPFKIM